MTETIKKIRLHQPPSAKTVSAISQATSQAGGNTEAAPEKARWSVGVPRFLKKTPFDHLTDEQLRVRLARSEKRVGWGKHLGDVVVHATIFGMAAAMVGLVVLGVGFHAAAVWGLASGVGIFFGTGYSYRGVVRSAMRERDTVSEVLEPRVLAKQAAAEEFQVALQKKAADDFRRAVDRGLPLEQNITVKAPLKFKTTPRERTSGVDGIMGKLFNPS